MQMRLQTAPNLENKSGGDAKSPVRWKSAETDEKLPLQDEETQTDEIFSKLDVGRLKGED
jgi:hypothetical protein